MTPTEAVKILLEGIEEAVRHLNPQVREPVRALAALQRAALAATAEPAATCSCGFPRTAGYPRRACEACGRAATEPAKGDGILRTLDGKPMYLVGRTTDAPATAEPAVRCDECAPEWSCFNGSTPCHKKPATTYSADDLRKVAAVTIEACAAVAYEWPAATRDAEELRRRVRATDLDALRPAKRGAK